VPLTVQVSGPENSGNVSIVAPIELSISIPVEEATVQCHPSAEFSTELGEDNLSLRLVPSVAWEYDTTYTLEISGAKTEFTTQKRPNVSIFAGGDVLLDKRPGENIASYGPDYVFAGVSSLMGSADIRFVNLENPATHLGEPVQKSFRFRSPPDSLDALVSVRVNAVSFANNHSFDYGEEAFLDTLDQLSTRGIKYVGAGKDRNEALRPIVFEHNGLRVAIIGFMQRSILPAWSPGLWEAGQNKSGVIFLDGVQGQAEIIQAVHQIRDEVDIVLVSLHWGVEGRRRA